MEKIIKKIAEIRSKKGFSYENMAQDLELSTSAYRKIETGETKLTVERLVDISKILETPLNDLLDTESQKNFSQEIRENATGYQAVDNENIYYEYSEVSKKLIEVYEQQIKELKAEIEHLKSK
jgi:transcriptional regulator with XRE-family HTH domain